MKTRSFDLIASDLSESEKKLNELFNLSFRGTRFQIYHEKIVSLAKHFREGNISQFSLNTPFEEVVSCFLEVDELIHITNHPPNNLSKKKIKKILSGPKQAKDEDSNSNEARNTLFEVALASYLTRVGFDATLTNNEDIRVEEDDKIILIECKRPQKEKTIEANINSAKEQLKRRLKISNEDGKIALIAISISKLLSGDTKFIKTTTEKDANQILGDHGESFAKKYAALWENEIDIRLSGALIHAGIPVVTEADGLLSIANFFTIKSTGQTIANKLFLSDLARKLKTVLE